jgi:hypothetical protein
MSCFFQYYEGSSNKSPKEREREMKERTMIVSMDSGDEDDASSIYNPRRAYQLAYHSDGRM